MQCVEFSNRPSWRVTLTGKYQPESPHDDLASIIIDHRMSLYP